MPFLGSKYEGRGERGGKGRGKLCPPQIPGSAAADDIKVWTELPVAECVRTAQDKTAWRAKVSLALAFDPEEGVQPVQSSPDND